MTEITCHDVDIQSIADVPRNVAVEWPNAGIISTKVENNVALSAWFAIGWVAGVNELGVSALGIVGTSDGSIPSASALSDNPEIVTVEMH
jgi:hypothetical protein